jgi:hypothetical protein
MDADGARHHPLDARPALLCRLPAYAFGNVVLNDVQSGA